MKSGNSEPGTGARRYAAPTLAMALMVLAASPSAGAETVLAERDAVEVFSSMAAFRVMPAEWNSPVESACYFDSKVEKSMGCSWSTYGAAASPFRVRQEVKKRAVRACKKRGGKKCVRFWRNGALEYEGLPPETAKRLGAVLKKMAKMGGKARLLPEGVGVGKNLRKRFEKISTAWERHRKRYRGRNLQYVLCANEQGPWAASNMVGARTGSSNVRRMCVMKCRAVTEYLSKKGRCYVVYENGKFVNAAAEKAIRQ